MPVSTRNRSSGPSIAAPSARLGEVFDAEHVIEHVWDETVKAVEACQCVFAHSDKHTKGEPRIR